MTIASQNLSSTFAVLCPDMRVSLEAVRPELYGVLDSDYNDFKNHALIACHDFAESWDMWEMHPEGDEVVALLSGAATMALWRDGKKDTVQLTDVGSYVVIPRGIWHTAQVAGPTKMLFITPGENTQHGGDPADSA